MVYFSARFKRGRLNLRAFLTTFILAFSISTPIAQADPAVNRLIKAGERVQKQAAASQRKIEKLSERAVDLFARFQLESKRLEDLEIYNNQLEKQLNGQQQQISEIKTSLENISIIERQITPLLLRMINALEQFVKLDMPFLLTERKERVASLTRMMARADISIAEKFRQVFSAYSIELEFGKTIETYRGTLPGTEQDVEFLRIGRIGLLYQSLDGEQIGAWDKERSQWVPVDNRFRRDIRRGLRMAKKQISPQLLKLPISAPNQAGGQP